MAGHSKWANIKHKKAAQDAKRGQIFTKLARQLTVAAKEGGADPESNFKLRLAVDNARAVNMPNDNIERAIGKGIGGLDGDNYEEIIYEGYGPYGVAILIEVLTDNRNRTVSELRHGFSKNGGNLGESGCVAWMFEKKGLLVIDKDTVTDEDEFMLTALEAGAEDIESDEDVFKVLTDQLEFATVRQNLAEAGFSFLGAEVSMIPENSITVSSQESTGLERLIDALEELDDVQEVYSNYDVQPGQ